MILAAIGLLGACRKASRPESSPGTTAKPDQARQATARPEQARQAMAGTGTAQPDRRISARRPARTPAERGAPVVTTQPTRIQTEAPMFNGRSVAVSFVLPAGWKQHKAAASWEPAAQPDPFFPVAISVSVTCGGSCAPEAIAANLQATVRGFRRGCAQPNYNTSDPKMNAIRAKVETLAEEALPKGQLLALRVTYDPAEKATAHYPRYFAVRCSYHDPDRGRPYFVTLSARGPLAAEAPLLKPILDVCRSLQLHGPAKTAADRLPPAVVTGKGFEVAALPKDAYAVLERTPEGLPSKIKLLRPLTYNGVPFSLHAPPTVNIREKRAIITQLKLDRPHGFTVPGLAVKGGVVPCLDYDWVDLSDTGVLTACRLSRAVTINGRTYPRFLPLNLRRLSGKPAARGKP